MQYSVKIIASIILGMLLSACVSTRVTQEVERGKINFEAGNYKQSFHELLPLASEGSVHAQYAVGYMYYYGYGVAQDSESGLFWMRKAAAANYVPAIKALKMINGG
jgi:TPR repeat protein